jgi:hypothetical protein
MLGTDPHPHTTRSDSSEEEFQGWRVLHRHRTWIDGELFINRLVILQCPWFAVLLTGIRQPDTARDPHDHSRSFITFILSGSYTEQTWRTGNTMVNEGTREHPRFSAKFLSRHQAHHIVSVRGHLRTLLLAGPHTRRPFSFWPLDNSGPISYLEYK